MEERGQRGVEDDVRGAHWKKTGMEDEKEERRRECQKENGCSSFLP